MKPNQFEKKEIFVGESFQGARYGKGIYKDLRTNQIQMGYWQDDLLTGAALVKNNNSIIIGNFNKGCLDGVAEVKTEDAVKVGEMNGDGVLNGAGYRDTNLQTLQGYFVQDKLDGFGVVINKSRDERLFGKFKNGLLHGPGIQEIEGNTFCGDFTRGVRNGFGLFVKKDSSYCLGQWSIGLKHGFCICTMVNNDRFEGQFQNNKKNGLGLYLHKLENATYVGYFSEGTRHGLGRLDTSKSVYVGEWQHSKRHGIGYSFYHSKKVYFGNFRNDQKQGIGIEINEDFEYKGEFYQGKAHGKGLLIKNNTTQACIFHEGNINRFINSNELKEILESLEKLDMNTFLEESKQSLSRISSIIQNKRDALTKRYPDIQQEFKEDENLLNDHLIQIEDDLKDLKETFKNTSNAISLICKANQISLNDIMDDYTSRGLNPISSTTISPFLYSELSTERQSYKKTATFQEAIISNIYDSLKEGPISLKPKIPETSRLIKRDYSDESTDGLVIKARVEEDIPFKEKNSHLIIQERILQEKKLLSSLRDMMAQAQDVGMRQKKAKRRGKRKSKSLITLNQQSQAKSKKLEVRKLKTESKEQILKIDDRAAVIKNSTIRLAQLTEQNYILSKDLLLKLEVLSQKREVSENKAKELLKELEGKVSSQETLLQPKRVEVALLKIDLELLQMIESISVKNQQLFNVTVSSKSLLGELELRYSENSSLQELKQNLLDQIESLKSKKEYSVMRLTKALFYHSVSIRILDECLRRVDLVSIKAQKIEEVNNIHSSLNLRLTEIEAEKTALKTDELAHLKEKVTSRKAELEKLKERRQQNKNAVEGKRLSVVIDLLDEEQARLRKIAGRSNIHHQTKNVIEFLEAIRLVMEEKEIEKELENHADLSALNEREKALLLAKLIRYYVRRLKKFKGDEADLKKVTKDYMASRQKYLSSLKRVRHDRETLSETPDQQDNIASSSPEQTKPPEKKRISISPKKFEDVVFQKDVLNKHMKTLKSTLSSIKMRIESKKKILIEEGIVSTLLLPEIEVRNEFLAKGFFKKFDEPIVNPKIKKLTIMSLTANGKFLFAYSGLRDKVEMYNFDKDGELKRLKTDKIRAKKVSSLQTGLRNNLVVQDSGANELLLYNQSFEAKLFKGFAAGIGNLLNYLKGKEIDLRIEVQVRLDTIFGVEAVTFSLFWIQKVQRLVI